MSAVATEVARRATGTLQDLVSPLGGLITGVQQLPVEPSNPPLKVFSANLGDVSTVIDTMCGPDCLGSLDGTGTGVDPEHARMVACAEALERYANSLYADAQLRWATADELTALGEDVLDLDALPRCSATELADPHCPVVPPAKSERMRWIKGMNLRTRELSWVPAVLVYMHIAAHGAEKITNPISTGAAAHSDPVRAVTGALCEVIERDAISLVWLQELALPRIELDVAGPQLRKFLDLYADRDVTVELFDATTDLGIPIVYAVSTAPNHPDCDTVVACAAALDPQVAAAKAISETVSVRIALQGDKAPDDVHDFSGVSDGAIYMGHPSRAPAYDFLLGGSARRRLSEMPNLATGDAAADLRVVLDRLDASGLDSYLVDLSPDEAIRAGMTVVRAVIPGLLPLSFTYRSRFLGSPRLYEAPVRMGYPSRPESELNSWPQPFA
ncbi:YcaO-like family protein [Actinoplanes cyaneus]|uniref:YcaO-like family protein n=1 Tax=Actinoplanes cyaneus TaxID=52696 RepID=UPI001941D986|nr:YcaO-like family protein [Actinoplanes cyaneus]MCW2140175.1 ribosomal protein S12 methylthiotransferase accessory factor [Actinoplanes cyaneus]